MASGAEKRRRHVEMVERRQKVIELYGRHINQVDIAKSLHVNQGTISRDIAAIGKEWLEKTAETIGNLKARELLELDQMEKDCALRFSQGPHDVWIKRRLEIKQHRARLMGLDAPVKIVPTNIKGDREYNDISDREYADRFLAVLKSLGKDEVSALLGEQQGIPDSVQE